ncbi:hypothetical protein G1H11_21905 [Phytoactinopolyspora alkaliphila]|uniref:F420-dependent oxidoreductase n=1 Tax=Phytoactinopolyspora alkaliphila TaxID=1783498 RepID=A0A6N9YSD7_9ACTN|nr:Pr6Pr family membrane protein [Phytoactinopolyspora alkaliphila]NED97956.1 hypothetical protein [Phytoactinopolyspora alkaliphila]
MRAWRRSATVARGWHLATLLVIVLSLGAQLVMVIRGIEVLVPEGEELAPTPTRVVNFFSYFTVQSNILLAVAAAVLVKNPRYDGPAWRVLRLAGLMGITVTGIVFVTLLRPIVELDGLAAATNVGFHYLSPLLGVAGWALFDPHQRLGRRVLLWTLIWPLAWLAYTLIRGAARDWYPYPFIDVVELGYGRTLANALGVTVLMLVVGGAFLLGDRRLTDPTGLADDTPSGPESVPEHPVS